MFRNFSHSLAVAVSQAVNCVVLSLCWVLCSLPLITIGASSAALYDAVYYGFLRGEKHPRQRFFRSFRNNLKPGILPGIVYLVLFCAGGWGLLRLWNTAVWEQVSFGMFGAAAFAVALLLGTMSVLFPLLSRFNNTFGGLLRNTVLLALVNLPRTLGLGFVNTITVLLCAKLVLPLLFLPALANLLGTVFLEPMFRPYMGDEPKNTPEDAA